jgi:hypothetical protein
MNMSEQNQSVNDEGDGIADAIAATAVITIVIAAVIFWLSGFAS